MGGGGDMGMRGRRGRRGALWDGPDRCDGGRGRYGEHGRGGSCMGTRQNIGIVGGVERGRLGMNKGPAPARVTNRGQTSTCTVYLNLTSVSLLLVVFCTILSRSVSLLLLLLVLLGYYHIAYIYRHRLPVCLSVRHSYFSLESRSSDIYLYDTVYDIANRPRSI
ncbi:hypothetical protein EDB85DRAFT_1982274 [Lactarius pseudohatsudake]|nr:hypothetical protein EDB85DRAFT_1982274 [Lactarius pseudohatsudake]